jgi:hypothetical protein
MPSLSRRRRRPLGVFHCTLTGSAVLGALLLLSWATSAVADIAASRRFLALFTQSALDAPASALAQGLMTALVIGGVAGAALAIAYNLLALLSRR